MRFFCPGCGTRYTKNDEEIPPAGLSIPCEKCGFVIAVGHPKTIESIPSAAPIAGPTSNVPQASGEDQWFWSKPPTDSGLPLTDDSNSRPPETIRAHKRPQAKREKKVETSPAAQSTPPVDAIPPAPANHPDAIEAPPRKSVLDRLSLGKRLGSYLSEIGTGRSGAAFRFRDLFYAIAVPCDPRKLLVGAAGVFIGCLLCLAVIYFGALTKSSVGVTIGFVLGGLLFWICTTFALAITTYLADREMQEGKHLPLWLAVRFIKNKPLVAIATPLFFVVVALALAGGVALLALAGSVPYAGPLTYGLTFLVSFTLALGSVATLILLGLTSFSYLPILSANSAVLSAGPRHVLRFFWNRPGRYLLHILIAAACSLVIYAIVTTIIIQSMVLLSWIGDRVMGEGFLSVLNGMPRIVSVLAIFALPTEILAGFQEGWQFDLAGWLVFLGLLFVFSLAVAFVLVYFFGAGVVNYHLLTQNRKENESSRSAA